MSLKVEGLSKIYGTQKAVDNISFQLNKGEIVGFLGPNGAGKSTTMKMITGYLQPDAGSIRLSGMSVEDQPMEARRLTGYLPESNALYYDMYVREYLDFVAAVHHLPQKKKRITEVIALTGLTPESGKKIGQLSKGYKQRVGLCAALIHQPEVLVLDEPTSGLDPNQIIEIRNVIKDQGKNRLVLFSSHILQEVEAICDRVIIINKGRLVADSPLYALQQQQNGNTITVTFGAVADQAWFVGIPTVTRLEQTAPNVLQLYTDQPEAVRKRVFELSLQHNLNIVSLHSENQSLEEVFRSLTASGHSSPTKN